jgi:hypothetical protein
MPAPDIAAVFTAAQAKLLHLAVGLRDREPLAMQRINAFVLNKTGAKFNEYLTGPTPVVEKLAVVQEITAIVESGDLSKLPSAPNGQASAPPTAPRTTPPPAPPKVEQPKQPEVKQPEPPPAPPAPPAVDVDDLADDDIDADELAGAIQTIVKVAAKRKEPAAPPAPAFTEADVRRIIRHELADAMEKIAKALRA